MILTIIPFSGFYNSIHNDNIEQAENRLFENDEGDMNDGLQARFNAKCDYSQVFIKYAAAYVEQLAENFKIPSLKFIELDSPREYNFRTDQIICSISREDLRAIYKSVDRKKLADHVRENCTSRDGFISFFDPDVKTWGHVDKWEQPQTKLLLETYCSEFCSDDFSEYELYCMERHSSNGYFENWLCDACPISDRLYAVHNYLQTREARK